MIPRQIEVEGRAHANLGFKADLTVQFFNYRFGNAQSQACAALLSGAGLTNLCEFLENLIAKFLRDASAVVSDVNTNHIVITRHGDFHFPVQKYTN